MRHVANGARRRHHRAEKYSIHLLAGLECYCWALRQSRREFWRRCIGVHQWPRLGWLHAARLVSCWAMPGSEARRPGLVVSLWASDTSARSGRKGDFLAVAALLSAETAGSPGKAPDNEVTRVPIPRREMWKWKCRLWKSRLT